MDNELKTTKVTMTTIKSAPSSVQLSSSSPQFGSSDSLSFSLAQSEELLLMRFVDGECRFFERWKARRLLSRSEAAKMCAAQFVENSCLCKESLKSFAPFTATSRLADCVDRRLVEEAKLALILGERRVQSEGARKWSIGSIVSGVVRGSGSWAELDARYALAGSLAAAVVFAVVLGPKFITGTDGNIVARGPSSGTARTLSLELASNQSADGRLANEGPGIRLTQDQIPQATSVDWVRGGGRIELVRTPDDDSANTPIIWIKRRSDISLAHSARGLRQRQVGLSDAYAISHGR